ncbi:hypothetical protein BRC71_10160 [Halobacteriales archaeon QH_7_65_31]|nr:MAG: hypothetical protein BRC71_10160 [Halobacteriales archaeon QH_7_65_31]
MTPTPDNYSAVNKNGRAGSTRGAYAVAKRLEQENLNTKRYVGLESGSKICRYDHTDPKERYDDPPEANYGVYAGEGLVLIDIDSYRDSAEIPETISCLPSTLTVSSPHKGEHRYYQIDEEPQNIQKSWGEIRAENQYVVGPGSELTSCKKDWHDCSEPQEGLYVVESDEPIASITRSQIQPLLSSTEHDSELGQRPSSPSKVEERPEFPAVEYDPINRLTRAIQNFAWGDKLGDLWEGNYEAAGFGRDRSRAEFSLCYYLGWLNDADTSIIKRLMSYSCRRYPFTDSGNKRKWLSAAEIYRETTLANLEFPDGMYEKRLQPLGYEDRPKTSHITRTNTNKAIMDLGIATTSELIDHPATDRGKRQTQRALDELLDDGLISYHRDGRRTFYYPKGLLRAFATPERLDNLDIDADKIT